MIIRNLDAAGDWTFGNGRQNYLSGSPAIALNIKTRLRSFLNDTFWAMNFGIDWWNLIGGKTPTTKNQIILQCRAVIGSSWGVVRVNSVAAVFNPTGRGLTTTFSVDSSYSRNISGAAQL